MKRGIINASFLFVCYIELNIQLSDLYTLNVNPSNYYAGRR